MRATFEQIRQWAANLGVCVEKANKPRCMYEVWTDGSVIDECMTLGDVCESVGSFVHETADK